MYYTRHPQTVSPVIGESPSLSSFLLFPLSFRSTAISTRLPVATLHTASSISFLGFTNSFQLFISSSSLSHMSRQILLFLCLDNIQVSEKSYPWVWGGILGTGQLSRRCTRHHVPESRELAACHKTFWASLRVGITHLTSKGNHTPFVHCLVWMVVVMFSHFFFYFPWNKLQYFYNVWK